MVNVTAETITKQHLKAARGLLEVTAADLARLAGVDPITVRRFETGHNINAASREAIYEALTGAGVMLFNGGQPGARLMKL